MELEFLGGAREVGRSCIAVESEGLHLFLDCGVSPNEQYKYPLVEKAKRPHAIAVSHAHLDHSGFVPAIFKHANPPVLCTFPTIPLIDILLEDTRKLLDEKRLPQYFSNIDLKRMNRSFLALPYGKEYGFFNGNSLEFYDAGHIIGSAQALLKTKKGNLLYSGDFNRVQTIMHNPARLPGEGINYLIMESTYGDREHPDRKALAKKFCSEIRETIERKGTVVIPAFAIGRTQEILQLLYENGLIEHAVVDGMGLRASEACLEFPSYLRNAKKFQAAFEEVEKAYSAIDRKRFARPGRAIICTAGMLEGGPALSYIQRLQRNGTPAKIFLTGYQAEGTNGRLLNDQGKIRLNGKTVEFQGEVQMFDFSAHSGQRELLEYAKQLNPEKILLVHGDPEKMGVLQGRLKEEGLEAEMPELGQKIRLE